MSIDTSILTVDQIEQKRRAVQQRLSELPNDISRKLQLVAEAKEEMERISQLIAFASIGEKDDRAAHHAALDLKSARGRLYKHQSDLDQLRSEESNLRVVVRELSNAVHDRASRNMVIFQRAMRDQQQDRAVLKEEANVALARCLCAVASDEGCVPSVRLLQGVVGQVLDKDGALAKEIARVWQLQTEHAMAVVLTEEAKAIAKQKKAREAA